MCFKNQNRRTRLLPTPTCNTRAHTQAYHHEKMASIADEIEYKLDEVPATRIASDVIDKTFRSSSIGKMACLNWRPLCGPIMVP